MKHFHFLILSIILLLSQWGSIDHIYHAHKSGEVCDYCISAQPLEHAVSSAVQSIAIVKETPVKEEQTQTAYAVSFTRHYAARAPPRLI
ncbi:MAG: hypothetical protein QM484_00985 [Woeseiaceae bacterium]